MTGGILSLQVFGADTFSLMPSAASGCARLLCGSVEAGDGELRLLELPGSAVIMNPCVSHNLRSAERLRTRAPRLCKTGGTATSS